MKLTICIAVALIAFSIVIFAQKSSAYQQSILTISKYNRDEEVSSSRSQAVRIVINAQKALEFNLHIMGRSVQEIQADALTRLYQHFDSNNDGQLEIAEVRYFPDLSRLRQQLWNPLGVRMRAWIGSDGKENYTTPGKLIDRFQGEGLSFVHVGYGTDEASGLLNDRLRVLLADSTGDRSPQSMSRLRNQQFEALDINHDGHLSANEIVRNLAYPSCWTSKSSNKDTVGIDLQGFKVEIGEIVSSAKEPQSTAFQKLNTSFAEIEVFIRFDSGTGEQCVQSAKQHMEQLFTELDVDHDGSLSASELDTKTARWMRESVLFADRNCDGSLLRQELEDWLRVWGDVVRAQIQVSVLEQSIGLWETVDTNMDGRLSLAEWVRTDAGDKRLAEFTGQQVGETSLRRRWCITISHGQPLALLNGPTAIGGLEAGSSHVAPRWFQAADANGDQHLQKAEFVGPITIFDQWDQDGDGLISLSEISAVEARE